MVCEDKLFFHKAVTHLAQSLARINDLQWEKLNALFSLCPEEPSCGTLFKISLRDQDSIIALGIYLLESGLQHKDKNIPYLLSIAQCLNCSWLEEIKVNIIGHIPIAVKFSFSIHTLLSDVAARCPARSVNIEYTTFTGATN